MTHLKAAVVGCGFMGRTHIEALRRIGIEVHGVLGCDREESQKTSSQLSIPRFYESLSELLADAAVQVVHLCTPNHLHYSQAKETLLAGKHVICEKPLALTPEESQELAGLARQTGLFTAVNYNLRFYPICQEARARIQKGELGNPYLIHGGYLQDWLIKETDWNWRLEAEKGGKLRVVGDIGTHWMDLLTYLTGLKIQAVMAYITTVHPQRSRPRGEIETFAGKLLQESDYEKVDVDTEDAAAILVRFENGALGTITLSQVSAGRKSFFRWELNGSKCSMRWDQEEPNSLWLGFRDSPNQLLLKDPSLFQPETRPLVGFPGGHAEGYPDTFAQFFRQFYAAVESGILPEVGRFATFEDGHHEMVLCQAILRSAQENRWVEIEEIEVQYS